MTISWARSKPEELRAHHARDAAEMAGALPEDVIETGLTAEGALRRQFRLDDIFRQSARHLRRIARMMRPQLLGFRAGPGDCHIVRPSSALTSVARERMIDSWQFPQP